MSKDNFKQVLLDSSYEGIGLDLSTDSANTTERLGWLRIHGRETHSEDHRFNIVAKKVEVNHFTVETKMEFNPTIETQKAGLIAYFDIDTWYFLYISYCEESDHKQIHIQSSNNADIINHISLPLDSQDCSSILLKISLEENKVLFYYSIIKHRWHKVGPSLNSSTHVDNNKNKAKELKSNIEKEIYIGMGISNLSPIETHADFDYFKHVSHS